MKKLFLLTLLYQIFIFSVFSQGIFTVVSSKNVQIKKGNKWVDLPVGTKLVENDIIKAKSGGIASFLYSGQVVKFNRTKETKTGDYQKSIHGGPDYLKSDLLIATKDKLNLTADRPNVGGYRDIGSFVYLITPRTGTKYYNSLPLFVWNQMPNENDYQLYILTEELTQVKSIHIKDTLYQYTKDDPPLEKGKRYICFIKPSKSTRNSDYQAFYIATEAEADEIQKKLDLTEKVIADADDVAKCILRGSAYEELGLYSEAYNYYKSAINMAPDEKVYKKMCADFLWKVNLIKQIPYLSGYTNDK
jgi:hypothetical protein